MSDKGLEPSLYAFGMADKNTSGDCDDVRVRFLSGRERNMRGLQATKAIEYLYSSSSSQN
eukprot:scaffold10861_cov180-Amphora_coffeaeformis.AAC.2